jgi:hypothetical protein
MNKYWRHALFKELKILMFAFVLTAHKSSSHNRLQRVHQKEEGPGPTYTYIIRAFPFLLWATGAFINSEGFEVLTAASIKMAVF